MAWNPKGMVGYECWSIYEYGNVVRLYAWHFRGSPPYKRNARRYH
jgi:hypothetical protein